MPSTIPHQLAGAWRVDDALRTALLMIMPKRDNYAKPLSKRWEAQFHGFLVQNRLVPEGKAKHFI
jgi:hypothetical protein